MKARVQPPSRSCQSKFPHKDVLKVLLFYCDYKVIITFLGACDGKIATVSSASGAVSQKRPSVPANLQQQRDVIQRRLNVFISAEEERSNEASDGLRLCPSPSLDQLGPPAFGLL